MEATLHLTSGDCAGENLEKSGLPGEIFVWHDVLYDGPRNAGWPTAATLEARARYLEQLTGEGMERAFILETLQYQYEKLSTASGYERIVLWFDSCLFDQSMLAHILTCMADRDIRQAELVCVDAFPGVDPFHGLGQLQPSQLASLYDQRQPVTDAQYAYAAVVDNAFADQESALLAALTRQDRTALPWVPDAVKRWLKELPDPATGLGRLEQLALEAIRSGCEKPGEIFTAVAAADTPPQYWGDITLWAKINGLADRTPPLVSIVGPTKKLPQWESEFELKQFTITILADGCP